jgi:hypothetical protein
MVLWSVGCGYIGFYIMPHCQPQILKAVAALLGK